MADEETPRSILTQVGGWKLGKTLGRGSYAHVRLAEHVSGHKAACKILPALHYPGSKSRSWDETVDAVEAYKEVVLLKALSGARMKGIVGLEGVMVEGGWTYVFLTLYKQSASSYKTPLGHKYLVTFFRHLLYYVHTLHLLNISHEDLKRSNVLVDEKGWPILVDFGFSHFRADGHMVKSAGGTLDYSSPEKVLDGYYDPKANDVWALGILFSKLLDLAHPYISRDGTETSAKVKERMQSEPPCFDWQTRDLVPGGKMELLMGMLDKDPVSRSTIPQILRHPYLQPVTSDPRRWRPPSYELPKKVTLPLPTDVIHDLCFLAYLNEDYRLCETPKKIAERLESPFPCWEKRWAGMLSAWVKRAEMDWEDVPEVTSKTTINSVTAIRSSPQVKSRVLREIRLSPNVETRSKPPITTPRAIDDMAHHPKWTAQKPKSLMYGMKTREESTKTVQPKMPLTSTGFNVPRPQAKGANLVGNTELVLAPSPKKSIPPGGFGRTKRAAVTKQSHTRRVSSEDRTGLSIRLAINKRPTRYAAAGAPCREPSSAGLDDDHLPSVLKSNVAMTTQSKARTTVRTMGLAPMVNGKGKVKAHGHCIPGEQPRPPIVSRPEADTTRRRSPRLQDESKQT